MLPTYFDPSLLPLLTQSPFFLMFQVPEPLQHDPWGDCGGARVHGIRVGCPQQRCPPPHEEAVPHDLCHGGHGGKLLSNIHVWGGHGLRVRHHFPFVV